MLPRRCAGGTSHRLLWTLVAFVHAEATLVNLWQGVIGTPYLDPQSNQTVLAKLSADSISMHFSQSYNEDISKRHESRKRCLKTSEKPSPRIQWIASKKPTEVGLINSAQSVSNRF